MATENMAASKLPLTMIVAATTKNGIGKNNGLPWPMLKKEMAYFARVTKRVPARLNDGPTESKGPQQTTTEDDRRNVVIMGRKTWESIPPKFRPLKERSNIIISTQDRSQLGPIPEDVIVASDIISGLEKLEMAVEENTAHPIGRAYIIGGSSIYKAALEMPQTKSILLTRIHKEFDCDAYFPALDVPDSGWQRLSREKLQAFIEEDIPESPISEGEGENSTSYEFQLYERK